MLEAVAFGTKQTSAHVTNMLEADVTDIVLWRKIARHYKASIGESLIQWREKHEPNQPQNMEEMHEAALEGSAAYQAMVCIALSGVESGNREFTDQTAFLHEILNPRKWYRTGYNHIVYFPEAVAFLYQALHGAICIQTKQLSLAMRLARSRISLPSESVARALFKHPRIMGRIDSLGGKSEHAWAFLQGLPEKWRWLETIFDTIDEYRELISAYYMALSILEFADLLATDGGLQRADRLMSLCWLTEGADTKRRAYSLLISDPENVKAIWREAGVDDERVVEFWPMWIEHIGSRLPTLEYVTFGGDITYRTLLDDISLSTAS